MSIISYDFEDMSYLRPLVLKMPKQEIGRDPTNRLANAALYADCLKM